MKGLEVYLKIYLKKLVCNIRVIIAATIIGRKRLSLLQKHY